MSAKMEEIVQGLLSSMKQAGMPKTSSYDAVAVVRRIEDGYAWVHFEGGEDETPVRLTINCKPGDTVQVRVSGGTAFLVGNGTAPPTDDTRANAAITTADIAAMQAERASVAANSAIESASIAAEAASDAQESADAAQVSANNANEYAARALGNLSTVQSVTETLSWITSHGTMTLTSDTALDPTHVYFVVDANGDYVVGSTHYSVVTEPNADDLGIYYVLSIDESLNNYVATHLAVTNEGLWILPESTGYKILIATGSGTTYTAAGTYVIDASGKTVAKFGSDVILGDASKSHVKISNTKFLLYGTNGSTVVAEFGVKNDGTTGIASITETGKTEWSSTIDGVSYYGFSTSYTVLNLVSCKIGNTDVTSSTMINASRHFVYNSLFTLSTEITLVYTTKEPVSYAQFNGATANGRRAFSNGPTSYANGSNSASFGVYARANGDTSFAEGYSTLASGMYSHAEGYKSIASGNSSHAGGFCCVAEEDSLTAIGQFNKTDATGLLFVVGNGFDESSRSNAFAVRLDGVTEAIGGLAIKKGSSQTDPPFYLCLNESFANGGNVGYLTKANMKKAMLADDSGWQSVTFTSDFANYSSANPPGTPVRYRRIGKRVELTGTARPTRTITGSADHVTMFTLASGFRPPNTVYGVMHGSTRNIWLITINTNGTVTFSRYGGYDAYVDVTNTTWLPIHISFFID